MTRKNHTEIVFLIDRSGSMVSIAASMEKAFSEFILQQQNVEGTCDITLARFDSPVHPSTIPYVYDFIEKDIRYVVPKLQIQPRGMTALLESLGQVINDTGVRLSSLKEDDRPERVVFVVMTDGEENASKIEWTRQRVFEMISHQREKYSWEFIFMGANQDSIATSKALGIQVAANFAFDDKGTRASFNALSENIGLYRSGGSLNTKNLQNAYDKFSKEDSDK